MTAPIFASFPSLPTAAERPSQGKRPPRGEEYSNNARETGGRTLSNQRYPDHLPQVPSSIGNGDGRAFLDMVGEKSYVSYGPSAAQPFKYGRYRSVVLGADGAAIQRNRNHDQPGLQLYRKGDDKGSSSSRVRLPGLPPPTKIRRLLSNPQPIDLESSFIPLPNRSIVPQSIREEIQPSADDSDDEFEAEFDDMPLADRAHLDDVARMEKDLRSRPDDSASWLRYSYNHFPAGRRYRAVDQDTASVEIALSILDKAFAAHPNNLSNIELHLAYMHHLQSVWSTARIAQRWLDTTRRFPLVTAEGFQATHGGGCSGSENGRDSAHDVVVSAYRQAMATIRERLLDMGQSIEMEEAMLQIFQRHALFLKQSGFTEIASASIQALIELTFFKPPYMRYGGGPPRRWHDQLLQDFEAFWDTEAPRFGEAGALGWGVSETEAQMGTEESPVDPATLEDWFDREVQLDIQQELPGRLSLDISDDPYRIVTFDDISPMLFPILSPEVRTRAVYILLNFMGIVISPPDTTTNSASDPHLQWSLAADKQTRDRIWPRRPTEHSLPWREPLQTDISLPLQCPIKSWISDSNTLLASGDGASDLSLADLVHVDWEFTKNAISLLRPHMSDSRFNVLYMSLEAAKSVKRATMLAKEMLRIDIENALLWDAYARLERLRGKHDAARAVYAQNIARTRSRPLSTPTKDELDLWVSWVDMEIEAKNATRVGDTLCLLASGTPEDILARAPKAYKVTKPSATLRLRARQWLIDKSRLNRQIRYLGAVFLAWVDEDIESACDILEDALNSDTPNPEDEHARQVYLRFLQSLPVPPYIRVRHLVEKSIKIYPNNTMLLSALLRIGRQGLDIMTMVSNFEDREQLSVTNAIWSAWAAGAIAGDQFWKDGSAERERVRSILDKAVSSQSGSKSVAVWLLYIDFEIMFAPAKAKRLCYRAITYVGISKAIFMVPFRSDFIDNFTKRELYDWAQVVLERGVRVRIPIPLSPDDLEPLVELPEDEELQDDELEFLRERQRLMPYQ